MVSPEIIRRYPFFSGLSMEHINKLAKAAEEQIVDPERFFFHEEDLLGTTTFRLIKDRLIDEIINLQEGISDQIYDLDVMSEEITVELKELGLIWDEIMAQFQLLVLNLIIKNAIEMGFLNIEREKLMEGLTQSSKLETSKEGRLLKDIILKGLKMEALNLNTLTLNNN